MANNPLTFLFTDLEGSTPLWDRFPAEMHQASARHDELLLEAIRRHGGQLIKKTGDGFHAAFISPLDGLLAALAGQQAIAAERWPIATGPIKVRMGLHTGASEEREGDYYGVDVNIAARIMSIGHGGQVLLSAATAALVRRRLPEDCSLADLGEHRLKGVSTAEHIYQLCHADLVAEFPPLTSLAAFRHNLRPQRTSFIGREAELAAVKRLLAQNRLVTLLGPGGTGKTRLMLQVAEEVIEGYEDGVWLVELASLTDPDLVLERVAGALGVQEQGGRTLLETLVEYLRRKRLLLLLDNVEHLVQAAAEVAVDLLDRCPQIAILVTGREALFVPGETTLQIPSLSLPAVREAPSAAKVRDSESALLFVERGRAVRPDFTLTEENAAAIAEIVVRLDGIPLALELAAARMRMMTVQQIAGRLNDRFRLLTGGRRTALPRQQTLQALIDWSWNLLTEDERVLLRRLSVFSGGWSLAAAENVTGTAPLDEYGVLDSLEGLINKSLVVVQQEEDAEPRYGMLETIRQYAEGRLVDSGEAFAVRERHVAHFVALAEAYEAQGIREAYFEWRQRLAAEAANLRGVMDWIAADHPLLALRFAGMLLQWEIGWINYREARAWLVPAIEHAREALQTGHLGESLLDYIRALQAYGWLLVTHGEMTQGHAALDECIDLARAHGAFSIQAMALGMKAQALGTTVPKTLIAQMEAASHVARRDGHEMELLMLLFSAGQAYVLTGALESGEACLTEASQLLVQQNLPYLNAWVHMAEAILGLGRDDLPAAEEALRLTAVAYERLGDRRLVATSRSMLAHLYRRERRLDEALALYRETIVSWQELGHRSAVAHQLECFGFLAIEYAMPSRAACLLGAAKKARLRLDAPSTDAREIAELNEALRRLDEAGVPSELARAMAKGASMSLDEAVSYALLPLDSDAGPVLAPA
jgi:predicted ATPase/class 3 adenylate cyclase